MTRVTVDKFGNLYEILTGRYTGRYDLYGREQLNDPSVGFAALPTDGVTGAVGILQAAHDAVLAAGGGTLRVSPRPIGVKYVWEKTFFRHPKVRIQWPGKGLADFVAIDNFPLAQFLYRDAATGIVAQRDLTARCLIYDIPYAPFDPRGTIITPSSEGVIAAYSGFTIDGNKQGQNGNYVYGIYAPPGRADPNWPYVAGAFSVDQVANPGGGTINLNADAQAYYGFTADEVEIFNTSGTQFFAGGDRQRTHLLAGVKGTLGGINNADGTALTVARGFDLQGNDSWVFGGGFGNNNGACQSSGPSGMLRVQTNFFIPKGTDAASLCTRDESPNGTAAVGCVFNGLVRMETSAGNAIKARAGTWSGNFFGWSASQMQATGPNAGRPLGVTTEDGDAFMQVQAYTQVAVIGNNFSVAVDGTCPKYHISAVNGGGVLAWNPATSNPDGTQSYRGTSPWFTDATLGVIGGGWLDPYTQILHIGVSYKGLFVGANVAATQFVQFDSPVVFANGTVGQTGGVAPQTGYQGETFFTSASSALTNNVITDVTTLVVTGPIESDMYAEVQFAVGATATTAAVNAVFECTLSTVVTNIDNSNPRIYQGITLPIQTGLQNQPLVGLRVGPIIQRLAAGQNATLRLAVRGKFSTNATIAAQGTIHGRRW
jgi:hypothetical protein